MEQKQHGKIEWQSAALRHTGQGLLVADAQGHVLGLNETAEELTGWSEEEALGQHWARVCPLLDEHRRLPLADVVEAALRRSGVSPAPRRALLRHRLETERFVEYQALPEEVAGGHAPDCVLLLVRDAGTSRPLEETLRELVLQDLISKVSRGIAGDFNNVLAVIMGNAGLMQQRLVDPVECADQISNVCHQGVALTRQLLLFSFRSPVQLRTFDLNELVQRIETPMLNHFREKISLVLRLQPGLSAVQADAGRLEQALFTLGLYASESMPLGGTLCVETQTVNREEEQASLPPGPFVRLTVSYSGRPLDEETRQDLFRPFVSKKPILRALDLGMSAVEEIVRLSGGKITVESEEALGVRFHLYLPCP
jgi:PAS domain S-box-containing protein